MKVLYCSHPQDGKASRLTFFLSFYRFCLLRAQTFLSASFSLFYCFVGSLILFSFLARRISTLYDLLLIEFFTFLSQFQMGFTNPTPALRQSLLPSNFPRLSTLSCLPLSFTRSFRLAFLLAMFGGIHLSFVIGAFAYFFKITKVALFESVELFRMDPLLPVFFLFSSMISLYLYLLPPAALFMHKFLPSGLLLPWYLLLRDYTRSSDCTGVLV